MFFFTSDTHFGNDEIIKRENRPFKDIKEFEDFVVEAWNKQAGESDIIYHLGDFVNYSGTEIKEFKVGYDKGLAVVKRLKAKVILVIGNNEEKVMSVYFKNNYNAFVEYCKNLGFFDVKREDYLNLDGYKLYLNHCPRKHKDGFINIFGHTHRSTGIWKPFGLNVGCDLHHFYLLSEEELKRLIYVKGLYYDHDPDNLSFADENTTLVSGLNNYVDFNMAKEILHNEYVGFAEREFSCLDNSSAFACVYNNKKFASVEIGYQAQKFAWAENVEVLKTKNEESKNNKNNIKIVENKRKNLKNDKEELNYIKNEDCSNNENIKRAKDVFKQILECNSSVEAREIAKKNKDLQDKNWDAKKLKVMEELLRSKLEINPFVKTKLLETKNFEICCDYPHDEFWGIAYNHCGQNHLGKLLMKLREELN